MNDLHWADTGSGRPVVLLHGGFLHHEMWADQIPALAGRYRVIAPDARGHGRSANATGPFRPADDLAALLRHLGTGPAVLAGVSMGASIAVDTALEHPDLVSGLVITGAGTSEPEFTDPWTIRGRAAYFGTMAVGDLDGSVENFTLMATGPHRALDDLDPGVVARLRRMTRETMSKHTGSKDTGGEADPTVPVRDTWARVPKIDVPVLAVHGALDAADHIEMADRVARSVPDGRSVTIDGAAHYPNMERPDVYNEILMGFLRRL
ncbi:alpha/beta hydrolase [Spongiactinospora rosea]|uniref:Alpha/beta hydrolase n=1 Tax=Spongiactinospora rosea TaxID=2248750 RepID=A0A366M4Q4_9ACTN|nr:alpha/beta hydrolase [Spongiactinospora rosea]